MTTKIMVLIGSGYQEVAGNDLSPDQLADGSLIIWDGPRDQSGKRAHVALFAKGCWVGYVIKDKEK